MKVGDLVFNHSVNLYALIIGTIPTTVMAQNVKNREPVRWFELVLSDGDYEVANALELELISEGR